MSYSRLSSPNFWYKPIRVLLKYLRPEPPQNDMMIVSAPNEHNIPEWTAVNANTYIGAIAGSGSPYKSTLIKVNQSGGTAAPTLTYVHNELGLTTFAASHPFAGYTILYLEKPSNYDASKMVTTVWNSMGPSAENRRINISGAFYSSNLAIVGIYSYSISGGDVTQASGINDMHLEIREYQ